MEKEKKIDFENSIKRLDEIVKDIEGATLPLDKTISLYEEGSKLIKELEKMLKEAEERIAQVVEINK